MIHPLEARRLLAETVQALQKTELPLSEAQGYILAEGLAAPVDLPLFDQSAMDGYAVRFHGNTHTEEQVFELCGSVQAGDTADYTLRPGDAVRIFTGARVPADADAVVMQEKSRTDGVRVWFEKKDLVQGANIRYKGSQIQKGDSALPSGAALGAGAIGFLAGMGISRVPVIRQPRIALISTGNELKPAGTELAPGEIYESNLLMLQTALRENGWQSHSAAILRDDEQVLREYIQSIRNQTDILIISGGISVGEYDFPALY